MQLRKRWTTAALAAAAAGLATAAPAHAAPAPAASVATVRSAMVPQGNQDPNPQCGGSVTSNCWEYKSWYWTYSGCEDDGQGYVQGGPYNNYVCAGDHGLVVWLWLHRR
jgi:hypothetical protein